MRNRSGGSKNIFESVFNNAGWILTSLVVAAASNAILAVGGTVLSGLGVTPGGIAIGLIMTAFLFRLLMWPERRTSIWSFCALLLGAFLFGFLLLLGQQIAQPEKAQNFLVLLDRPVVIVFAFSSMLFGTLCGTGFYAELKSRLLGTPRQIESRRSEETIAKKDSQTISVGETTKPKVPVKRK